MLNELQQCIASQLAETDNHDGSLWECLDCYSGWIMSKACEGFIGKSYRGDSVACDWSPSRFIPR